MYFLAPILRHEFLDNTDDPARIELPGRLVQVVKLTVEGLPVAKGGLGDHDFRMTGRLDALAGQEQLLEQFFSGTQPGEADVDILVGTEPGKASASSFIYLLVAMPLVRWKNPCNMLVYFFQGRTGKNS